MENIPQSICGKPFGFNELNQIRIEIQKNQDFNRSEIAKHVCELLNWKDIQGKLKLMGARVALIKLHRKGLIHLPDPLTKNGNGKAYRISKNKSWPVEKPIECLLNKIKDIRLEVVSDRTDSVLWNGLIESYHYLGYSSLAGAQIRYLVQSSEGLLGCLSFSAAAWSLKPRDQWIGWDSRMKERNLFLIANNSRFLILPWVKVKNLASRILSLAGKKIRHDFLNVYGFSPVLLESFVETRRFKGTCYRAANWSHLGTTQGRGKCDRYNERNLPIKDIYVFPLTHDFRRVLLSQ